MKIIMTVSSVGEVSIDKKMKFVKKFFQTSNYERKVVNKGVLLKFNNSIGFQDIVYQPVSLNGYNEPRVKSPEKYNSPLELLTNGSYFFNKKNELITFVVDDSHQYHFDKRFSYDPMDIILKFQNFIYKIFPENIKIEIKHQNLNVNNKTFYLSQFYISYCVCPQSDIEVALSKSLKQKEIEFICRFFDKLGVPCSIEQDWCSICFGYNPNYPYHVTLNY